MCNLIVRCAGYSVPSAIHRFNVSISPDTYTSYSIVLSQCNFYNLVFSLPNGSWSCSTSARRSAFSCCALSRYPRRASISMVAPSSLLVLPPPASPPSSSIGISSRAISSQCSDGPRLSWQTRWWRSLHQQPSVSHPDLPDVKQLREKVTQLADFVASLTTNNTTTATVAAALRDNGS